MIPRIDAQSLISLDKDTLKSVAHAATETGFMTLHNTPFSKARMQRLFATYKAFFELPTAAKSAIDMAKTGSNRGWGAALSEQVDPSANADYKQYFDCGTQLPEITPKALSKLSVYAPNQWPDVPENFREDVEAYYTNATQFALQILKGVAVAIGEPDDYFDDKFSIPMTLLRGNYYPRRPDWAGEKDFGIAPHTDYGCLTLLATDGTAGLEVRKRGGGWVPVTAPVDEFVINFGDMLQMWTQNRVVATPHRVVGSPHERLSIPLFFNPNYDANIAPLGQGKTLEAGTYLAQRYNETYVHLQKT